MTEATRYSEAEIPTDYGPFRIVVYRFGEDASRTVDIRPGDEHVAIVRGEVRGAEAVMTRVHSECLTGEVFHSLKCDCRDQLDKALEAIAAAGTGVLVYLRQEGRGIGLGNKIRAYALQAEGADTVEANERLGFAADLRSYDLAAAILRDLGVAEVALMTNNPDKIAGLEKAGIRVSARQPLWGELHEHNREYLDVKRSKLGHKA